MVLLTALLACSGPDGGDTATAAAPRACNGSAALCDRQLDEVVLAVAHNAMNVEDEGWDYPNQHHGYEQQVADGIRGFMLDVYLEGDVTTLCHADCSLGSEPLPEALDRFTALLDQHPSDVFVFVIQDETEAAPIVAAFEAAGLVDRLIVPPAAGEPWPTLGALVDAGTQLLVTHEKAQPGAPAWYPAAYDLAWDNDYSSQSVDDFDCAALRGDRANPIFLVNHFLTVGLASDALAAEANPEAVIRDHVDRCEAETGDRVNWIAVDFYDVGDVVAVVDALNAR
ncbi:MAG: hypothetical protein R3F59_04630 [Myxococcota bacterium]